MYHQQVNTMVLKIHVYMVYTLLLIIWGWKDFLMFLKKAFYASQRLHLFDKKNTVKNYIVKDCYNF